MVIGFKRFQSRIGFFFLGLVSIVQSAVFLTVDLTNTRNARAQIEQSLVVGARNFEQMMSQRTRQLVESVRILSSDFAFKTALFTGDAATVHSVLVNQATRAGADAMILVSLDRSVRDDTRQSHGVYPPSLGRLIQEAEDGGQAAGLIVLDGKPYMLAVVPVLAPVPMAWLVAGYVLDDRLAQGMQGLLKLNISFYQAGPQGIDVLASSLRAEAQAGLAHSIPAGEPLDRVVSRKVAGEELLNYATLISARSEPRVHVLLQRSLTEELRPFQESRNVVVLLSIGGLVLSLFGAFFIARSVTRPVRALMQAVHRVEHGEYSHSVEIRQEDEIGELASSFNRMVKGLAERDKVRDLLGKFVPRAVAERLLSGEVVLGGEERVVTVLFSDLRNFTAISEQRPPQEIVVLLNAYFTRMSEVIERNHGLIDKFLGDGIMALFGAPAASDDDAGNALQAALEMIGELGQLNDELRSRGLPTLDIGVGINTSIVVAGNMGSPNRLNYTVIGDGVNLAARIEALTKRKEFNARVIATEASMRAAKRSFPARSLGSVTVRGKTEPVTLYALVESDPGGPELESAAAEG